LASRIAWRSEPAPPSLVFVTDERRRDMAIFQPFKGRLEKSFPAIRLSEGVFHSSNEICRRLSACGKRHKPFLPSGKNRQITPFMTVSHVRSFNKFA
jgi:hypothetical protein